MQQVKVLLGRFQPFTLGHLAIAQCDANDDPVVLLVVSTPSSKVNARHPFDDDLMSKEFDIIKKFPGIEDVLYVKSADIVTWGTLLKKHGYCASVWLTGSDEYKAYSAMARKLDDYKKRFPECDGAYTDDFYVHEVTRSEFSSNFIETISATRVREALASNDLVAYKMMMPKGTEKLFGVFRAVLLKINEGMNLVQYLKESLVVEGGHVFGEGSDKIKKEHIKNTLNNFITEFTRVFPNVKKHFIDVQTLGSVGKKDYSGDIDLAISDACLTSLEDWGIDEAYIGELYAKFAKRARTSTPDQLMKRAVLVAIGEKLEENSDDITVSTKSAGTGTLFCEYDQYDEQNKKLDLRVQIDINFGDIDWLKFAYFSDSYAGNVKGLHRTQLMLHMFSNKGYVFSHNFGVKEKATNEKVASSPKEAIALLNKLYHLNLNEKIMQNYNDLQEYLRGHLPEDELHEIYDAYLKTLDSTRCDIPEDLQAYWIENQQRLGLKGRFLPSDSRLVPYKA